MSLPHEIRAARDKALRGAFARIGIEGCTALEIQHMVGGTIHRETLRALLEDLVHARVLTVERGHKNNLYSPAHNWEEGLDAHIRARDERLGIRPAAEQVDDDEPAPGVPLVLLARRSLHPLHTVWGARP